MSRIVNFKKLHKDTVTPIRAHIDDAGVDLVAIKRTILGTRSDIVRYDFGISVEIPMGSFGMLAPRSSIYKKDLTLCNSVGIIDAGYRGELSAFFRKFGPNIYEVGNKVAQLIIIPCDLVNFVESDTLNNSSRGDSGFGSTGK